MGALMNRDRPKTCSTATTILLSREDLEMLRTLAFRRARLQGGRVSQGATIRDLVHEAHAKIPRGTRAS